MCAHGSRRMERVPRRLRARWESRTSKVTGSEAHPSDASPSLPFGVPIAPGAGVRSSNVDRNGRSFMGCGRLVRQAQRFCDGAFDAIVDVLR